MVLFGYIRYADTETVNLTRKIKSRRKVLGSGMRTGRLNIISIFGILV